MKNAENTPGDSCGHFFILHSSFFIPKILLLITSAPTHAGGCVKLN